MANHVIYVPGLSDYRSQDQAIIINLWRFFGIKPHFIRMNWADREDFNPKLYRLMNKIDSLVKNGHKVSLVGVSAGASAVLNVYAKNKNVHAVICICGKINNPQTISAATYRKNPAFKQSLAVLQDNLKKLSSANRKKIMSIHPLEDKSVPIEDTKIAGAVEKQVPTKGHALSIAYTILFKGRMIVNFIKST